MSRGSCLEVCVAIKRMVANRSPKDLGNRIKRGEIVFHHEVTNQSLWTDF